MPARQGIYVFAAPVFFVSFWTDGQEPTTSPETYSGIAGSTLSRFFSCVSRKKI